MSVSVFFWRPHTKHPEEVGPMTALVAVRDPDDGPDALYLAGIFFWRDGVWHSEEDDTPPPAAPFWWVPERDLVKGLA